MASTVEGTLGGGSYGMDGTFEMTVNSHDQTDTTQHFNTLNGALTRRDYTEFQVIANNVMMSMDAGGNGVSYSFSYNSGNQFRQNKSGWLKLK